MTLLKLRIAHTLWKDKRGTKRDLRNEEGRRVRLDKIEVRDPNRGKETPTVPKGKKCGLKARVEVGERTHKAGRCSKKGTGWGKGKVLGFPQKKGNLLTQRQRVEPAYGKEPHNAHGGRQ